MSETFLGVVCGPPMTIHVMRHLVNQDIVQKEVAERIEVKTAEPEWMSAKKDAFAPVKTIAPERAIP